MVDQKTIDRINELAHKAKAQGLTDAEKEEQAALRQAYIVAVKENLKSQLSRIDLVNPDGSIEHVSDRIKNAEKK